MRRRIFISESICGGGCEIPLANTSLAREGLAMLTAVLEDFSQIADVEVWTTWDTRLGRHSFPGVHVIEVDCPKEERRIWNELLMTFNDVLVIAPEIGSQLLERVQICEKYSSRLLGSSSLAVRLCGDKWETYRCLSSHHIATIPSMLITRQALPHEVNMKDGTAKKYVLKPRDGAGSQGMFFIDRIEHLISTWESITVDSENRCDDYLIQPYIEGMALSCSAMIGDGGQIDIFPVGRQFIDVERGFQYAGGEIPVVPVLSEVVIEKIHNLMRRVVHVIPGLKGYVGFDFILPADGPLEPIVVEINPRLTTSYLGYRRLTQVNLAERMLPEVRHDEPLAWKTNHPVRFSPDEATWMGGDTSWDTNCLPRQVGTPWTSHAN